MSNSNRPWWADSEVVETLVEQKHFDATLDYLGGLAEAIENRIAYGVDDPAAAARSALTALDILWYDPRRVIETWGGDEVWTIEPRRGPWHRRAAAMLELIDPCDICNEKDSDG
ncbi:hypothetical protein I5G97_gp054 [Mycobacterium phage Curiosium]|uniref:Uncharacterized protein n=1 Tax=Mycobacterium phage Curiosium TaxID=2599859 RepID=A0A5J6TTF3_9CAUD|nr:hypothetical protein I5G97_gp054 [Mycobacterium phage Curiosium]QFG14100.1 hypothetical protein PBI_CURIOSIUM_56 [Mycobacterium phage Curiosium]